MQLCHSFFCVIAVPRGILQYSFALFAVLFHESSLFQFAEYRLSISKSTVIKFFQRDRVTRSIEQRTTNQKVIDSWIPKWSVTFSWQTIDIQRLILNSDKVRNLFKGIVSRDFVFLHIILTDKARVTGVLEYPLQYYTYFFQSVIYLVPSFRSDEVFWCFVLCILIQKQSHCICGGQRFVVSSITNVKWNNVKQHFYYKFQKCTLFSFE